jgi:hypothetical protein
MGNRDLRVIPSAFETITDGIKIVQSLLEYHTIARSIFSSLSAPTVSAHGECTAIHVVHDDGSHSALQLRPANFVGPNAITAVNHNDFSVEIRRF